MSDKTERKWEIKIDASDTLEKGYIHNGLLVKRYDHDTLHIEFVYPSYDTPQYLTLNQCNVRASDGIRIHYDYKRDGWVIEQPSKFEWEAEDECCDEGWQETAFVKSWALDGDSED